MGRIVKKKRRKFRPSIILLMISLLCYLGSTLIVNTTNASLSMRIQTMTDELEKIQAENKTLNFEIENLENKDRVYEIAQINNMTQVSDNIISISGE